MALEDMIAKQNALLEKNNTLLEQLLSTTAGKPAATAAADKTAAAADKPAATAAADKPAAEGPTYEDVKKAAAAWLGEHPKNSEEQKARRAYLEIDLWPKLKISKLGDLEGKPADLKKVQVWLDTKAKSDLLGFGAGIFAAPATEEGADSNEEVL